jgi:perosamine synthetase
MIQYGKHHIDEADIQAVVDTLRGKALTQGPKVEEFEHAIAEYVGAKYAVAVSSATAGLHLAAVAAGMGPNKTLITSPITFVASANAALYSGGRPTFADIDPETINLSPERLEQALKTDPAVRVVVPVHFAGLPCDMTAIKKVADNAGVTVIEDAAHALGAKYPDGSRVGSCQNSLMTIFSFHPVKAIAAGEGGVITTNDERTHRKLLRLRSHGINKLDDPYQIEEEALSAGSINPWYYEMQELGFNYRLTDIQCALALSQLLKLNSFIERRRMLVERYDDAFKSLPNCRPAQSAGRDRSGHHIYVLRINFAATDWNRSQFMLELKSRKIGSQVHYIPVPAQPYYRNLGFRAEDYPNALNYYREALTIPLYYDLTDGQQRHVIATIREMMSKK